MARLKAANSTHKLAGAALPALDSVLVEETKTAEKALRL
jgi:hypothetical protein